MPTLMPGEEITFFIIIVIDLGFIGFYLIKVLHNVIIKATKRG